MTIPDTPARRVATRLGLVEALRNVPLTSHMNLEALTRTADTILERLPAPSLEES